MKQSMTLVIPVYRPDDRFVSLLRRVAAQNRKPEHLLVMLTLVPSGEKSFVFSGNRGKAARRDRQKSGEATDRTMQDETAQLRRMQQLLEQTGIAKSGIIGDVVPVKKADFDHGGTRDLAARRCESDLLVFMTMDALPADRELFAVLERAFDDPDVACAYARQLPDRNAGVLERYTRGFNYPDRSLKKSAADLKQLGIKTFFCSNVCAAYRRDLYDKLGGFEKHVIFNEDMIFAGKAVKAGYSVSYEADAKVLHSHSYSGRVQLHRNFDLGVSQAMAPEVFASVPSETEGIRMIKETAGYLLRSGRGYLLPELIWQSGCKYLGYRLGRSYRKLPRFLVRLLTMNPDFWRMEQRTVEGRKTDG